MFLFNRKKRHDDKNMKMYCFDGDYQWIREQLRTLGIPFESGHIMGECYVRTRLTNPQYKQLMSEAKKLGKVVGRWKALEADQNFEFDIL